MIRLLAEHSPYLAAVAERRPEWLAEIERSGELRQRLTAPTMAARLEASLGDQLTAVDLAAFRRRQLLRIAIRDLLGYATLAETTAEISAVADAILEVTLRRVYQRLRQSIAPVTGFAVISLGKLGAQELNYSSDIDLMFLYEGDHTAESARKLATEFTALLSAYTAEGVCYRVDLRLRPDGKLGEVALPLEAALHYYRTRARDWELQMLIKGRCSAGDPDLARRFFEAVDPLTYSTTLDFSAVEAVSETRMRIQEKARARQKNPSAIDVKLTPGGIRDIEFLVQCLQRLHGGREASLRHGGTLPALAKLRDQELLSPNEYGTLTQAYHFLRQIEHRLQLEHDQQTHTLPESSAELERLAHRLGHTASDLLAELNTHLAEVQRLYDRVIHSQKPLSSAVFEPVAGPTGPLPPPETVSPNVVRLFDQIAPRLAAAVRSGRPRRNAAAFEFLLEKISTRPGPIRWIEEPAVAAHVFDLFEHAPHLADELTRTPEYLAELHDLEQASPTASERLPDYRELLADLNDAADLRRFFHR
ncbi:MAG: glutamine-synthetase adenylyltransferase, partial [Bryobacteraceae bacterium]|nr:glutamine-synthetase adenylyltransferase [Bryobacteraceae bacterium]